MSSATLATIEPSFVEATSRIHFVWASTVRIALPDSRSHQIRRPS